MLPLSSTQIIYAGMQGLTGKVDPSAICRMCGGQLLLPSKNMKDVSSSWTDENMVRRMDASEICCACAWFMEGKNRTRIWNAKPVLYAAEKEYSPMTIPELYDFIKQDFNTPSVFMIRGRDVNLIRKHIQWRTLDSVTYSKKMVKVLFYGLQLWKTGSLTTGIAVFDADEMVGLVNTMCNRARDYVTKWITQYKEQKKKKPTEWFMQNFILSSLIESTESVMNTTIYLAAHMASYLLAEEITALGKESAVSA